jgi:hypothetical protein
MQLTVDIVGQGQDVGHPEVGDAGHFNDEDDRYGGHFDDDDGRDDDD